MIDKHDADTELIFDNVQASFAWRVQTRVLNEQTSNDRTLPKTIEQKKAAVKLVFKAFKSIALATDNPGMLKAFGEQKHDNRHVETICWTVVEGCIDRCLKGPLVNAYEPEKAKNTASIKTFAARLDAIVESLSRQKTICKHLLDAPYLNKFLDDPVGSRQRVESNRKLNKKKGGMMEIGKNAMGLTGKKGRPRGQKSLEADGDDEAEEYSSGTLGFQGDSSDVSSPFQTPDRPIRRANNYSAPPRIGVGPLNSGDRFRNETPTPPRRRRRAATSTALPPMRTPATPTPYGEEYDNAVFTDPNHGQQHPLAPMSTMQDSMVDPALYSYSSTNGYGQMGQTSAPMNSFEVAANVSLPFLCDRYKN